MVVRGTNKVDTSLRQDHHRRFDTIVFWLLIAGLAWVPFPLASNHILAWGANAVFFCSLIILYEGHVFWFRRNHPVAVRYLWFPALMFGFVAVWILVQISTNTPVRWLHPIWAMSADAAGQEVQGSISINRDLTVLALMRLVTAASVFWLALQLCRNDRRAYRMLQSIVLIAAGYALIGFIFLNLGAINFLWFKAGHQLPGWLHSTFIGKSHFATYAGMAGVVFFVLFFEQYRRQLATLGGSWRQGIAILLGTFASNTALLGAGILLLSSLLLTGSRGGILATVLGLMAACTLVLKRSGHHHQNGFVRPLILFGLVSVTAIGFMFFGDVFSNRLAQEGLVDDSRMAAYRRIISAIANNPVAGFGYGTFEDAFPMFRDTTMGIQGVYDRAHNSWLEAVHGLGVFGAAALVLCLGSMIFMCLLGAFRREHAQIIPVAAVCSGFLIGIHALADFSLQIQAVTLTFMALLGAGVAQSTSSRQDLSDG